MIFRTLLFKKLAPLVLLFLCNCTSSQTKSELTPIGLVFSPTEVKEDIQFLKQQLENFHPGFYRYTSKEDFELQFANAMESDENLDLYEFYGRLTSLISNVKCGHTRSRMSDAMRAEFESNEVFLPFSIKILKDGVFVNNSATDQLLSGSQILTINGESIDSILDKIQSHLSGDGFIETGKLALAEYVFDLYYQLYVSRRSKTYKISLVAPDKSSKEVTVDGVDLSEVDQIRNEFRQGDLLSMNYESNHAYMHIRTFSYSQLQSDGFDYEDFLEESFDELKEKGTKSLILDLRGNGGGRDDYGALLVSYLARDSFGYFEEIEVTRKYPGRSIKKGDKRVVEYHSGLEQWKPKENRFQGEVYVLTDGFSFSTCADVATVLHYNNWATLIGVETGGGYDGNTSGHSKQIQLPNSRVIVDLPMWKYTTANKGHDFVGRGAVPHHEIIPTWEEFSNGEDPVIKKALELMSQ